MGPIKIVQLLSILKFILRPILKLGRINIHNKNVGWKIINKFS